MNLPLTIALRERTQSEISYIKALSMMIPSKSKDKLFCQKIFQRLLNIDDFKKKKVEKTALQMYRAMTSDNGPTLKDKKDPVQIFLIRAILNKQSWQYIIAKNKWDGLLLQMRDEWNSYQQWIIFICFQGFPKPKALFLSSHITKRSYQSIKTRIRRINTPQNQDKLNKWLGKNFSALEQIHYEIQRKLLISMKQKKDFYQVAEIIGLRDIMKSTTCPISSVRSKWIIFLCLQFKDNKPSIRPVGNKHNLKISWAKYKPTVKDHLQEHKSQFQQIMKYDNFMQHYTNQIQASLLSDLAVKSTWKETKQHIQNLSKPFLSQTIAKQEETTFFQSQQSSFLPHINQLFTLQKSKELLKSKQFEIASIANKPSLTPQKPKKAAQPSKKSEKNNPITENNSSKKNKKSMEKDTEKRNVAQSKSSKKSTSVNKTSKTKKGKQQSNKKKTSVSKNDSRISKMTNNKTIQNPSQSFIQKKKIDKSAAIIAGNKSLQQNIQSFSSQQRLIMSLLDKLRQDINLFQQNYFSDISEKQIQAFWMQNMVMIEPIHRPILSIYQGNDPQMLDSMRNINIKKLIQAILTFEPQTIKNTCVVQKAQQIEYSEQTDEQMINEFAAGFDKLITKNQSKNGRNQQQTKEAQATLSKIQNTL